MRLQPIYALGALVLAASSLGACAADTVASVRLQQPALPADQAAQWGPDARLYRSVTLDYVGGLSRPTQYRRLLEEGLDRAGLLAPTSTAARYALQVDFLAALGSFADVRKDSWAEYRIINRATNRIVFEEGVAASFNAHYAPTAGNAYEILGARRGVLAPDGFVTAYGQADAQRMLQSITRFVMKLGGSDGVVFATVVPCLNNAEVTAMKGALTASGVPWRTDDCQAYRQPKTYGGLRFTSYQ